MRFLHYRLNEKLGEGAFGEVWRALSDHGEVAVKLLRAVEGEVVDVLAGEAERLSQLDHPRILRCVEHGLLPHAVGDFDTGTPFIATELVHGPSLEEVEPPDWAWVETVAMQILDGLAAAHARNIIHMDIKPSNILLRTVDPPEVVIADFGISYSVLFDPTDVTHPFAGTPQYMAPEQILQDVLGFGPSTDIYALACVVYELCCGRPPHVGPPLDVLRQHLESIRPVLRGTRFPVPERLQDWIDVAISNDSERFDRTADAAWAFAVVCAEFEEPPPRDTPNALVFSGARTMTWTRAEVATLPLPSALGFEAGARAGRPKVDFGLPLAPADWARGQDLDRGPFSPLREHREVADLVWKQIHSAVNHRLTAVVEVITDDVRSTYELLRHLLYRAHELGIGSHVLVPASEAANPADRIARHLLSVSYFRDVVAAKNHCQTLLDSVDEGRITDRETEAILEWTGELFLGDVVRSHEERAALAVVLLRCVPRAPHIALLAATPQSATVVEALLRSDMPVGAVAFVLVDEPMLARCDRLVTVRFCAEAGS